MSAEVRFDVTVYGVDGKVISEHKNCTHAETLELETKGLKDSKVSNVKSVLVKI